jgi:predicted transcriptional regulator
VRTAIIRPSEELEARVARAAEAAGTTSHDFILEAIAEKVDLAERRADLCALADQRWAEYLETGESISWEEVRSDLMDRIHGKADLRPGARKFAR